MATGIRHKPWVKKFAALLEQSPERVFLFSDLAVLQNKYGPDAGVPQSVSTSRLISVLCNEADLRAVELKREGYGESGAKTRYAWGNASDYEIGLALAKGSYLSHASAVFVHALTEQVPKTIYVNKEQSPKPPPRGGLSQPAIDRAFKNASRTSKYAFRSETARFVLLSGKNTGNLEVSEVPSLEGRPIRATKLERTLIDIVVRPAYAGGVFEVLAAYRAAKDRVSVSTLLATLQKLNFIYPYHQSIGFLMERAGYDQALLSKVESLGTQWDFYLDYGLKDAAYDRRWRLHYPQGL